MRPGGSVGLRLVMLRVVTWVGQLSRDLRHCMRLGEMVWLQVTMLHVGGQAGWSTFPQGCVCSGQAGQVVTRNAASSQVSWLGLDP